MASVFLNIVLHDRLYSHEKSAAYHRVTCHGTEILPPSHRHNINTVKMLVQQQQLTKSQELVAVRSLPNSRTAVQIRQGKDSVTGLSLIRYDTIEEFNVTTWTRKLSIQLYLAHVARN